MPFKTLNHYSGIYIGPTFKLKRDAERYCKRKNKEYGRNICTVERVVVGNLGMIFKVGI